MTRDTFAVGTEYLIASEDGSRFISATYRESGRNFGFGFSFTVRFGHAYDFWIGKATDSSTFPIVIRFLLSQII